ncbi:MAG: hypothetical protein QGG88_11755 [Gammaproteobacteria bacterium]|nr:hypothetical protein [Gammaproteobacteria bacterium]
MIEDDIINKMMKIKDIEGVLQTNVMGADIASNIEDEQLSHFIKYIVGFMPLFEKKAELGPINSVILCNDREKSNIGVFIGQEHSVGLIYNRSCSINRLHSKVSEHLESIVSGDR